MKNKGDSIMKRILPTLLILSCLSGCAGGAFLAGAATGGLVVYDRRNIAATVKDQKIRHEISAEISNDPAFENSHIVVSSFNRTILLVGQTPLASLRVKAEKIAKGHPEAKRIFNEVTINNPSSKLTRSTDTWLTTKVKTTLLATKGLKSGQIKVVTENGAVYLIGIVTPEQGNLAVDAARRVSGVQKIVKVFMAPQHKTKNRFA